MEEKLLTICDIFWPSFREWDWYIIFLPLLLACVVVILEYFIWPNFCSGYQKEWEICLATFSQPLAMFLLGNLSCTLVCSLHLECSSSLSHSPCFFLSWCWCLRNLLSVLPLVVLLSLVHSLHLKAQRINLLICLQRRYNVSFLLPILVLIRLLKKPLSHCWLCWQQILVSHICLSSFWQRLPFTLGFIGTMVGTVYVSMVLHSYVLSALFSILQVQKPFNSSCYLFIH